MAPALPSESSLKFVRSNSLSIWLLLFFWLGCVVVVGAAEKGAWTRALLWSLAFGAAGVLLGFIFVLPRTRPVELTTKDGKVPTANGASDAGSGPQRAAGGMIVNENLVEISDWLTKIIVGVGLVELKALPDHAVRVARFIAKGFPTPATAESMAAALMLYFTVLGFLAGYLLTRIYISVWFKVADDQVMQVELSPGRTIGADELTALQQPVIEDLQVQVAALKARSEQSGAVPPEGALGAPARGLRILWVDDEPKNNLVYVTTLEREGHTIAQALSTEAALRQLDRTGYDVVISDMRRFEGGREERQAGLLLLARLRDKHPDLPVMIFCSPAGAQRFAVEAKAAGARLVTGSGTDLLAAVRALRTA